MEFSRKNITKTIDKILNKIFLFPHNIYAEIKKDSAWEEKYNNIYIRV